jgi:hypothetical protein
LESIYEFHAVKNANETFKIQNDYPQGAYNALNGHGWTSSWGALQSPEYTLNFGHFITK